MTNPTPRASDLVLVPRELTPAIRNSIWKTQHGTCDETWNAALAAAPQPPALGGEPEVLAHVQGDRTLQWLSDDWRSIPVGTELIDRAHLAPLLAEIERLKNERDAHMEVARSRLIGQKRAQSDLRKAQARIAELEAQLATAKVVLPDRIEGQQHGDEIAEAQQWGWNACIDATAKLNGVTPDEQ